MDGFALDSKESPPLDDSLASARSLGARLLTANGAVDLDLGPAAS
jgi:hypothetical protein